MRRAEASDDFRHVSPWCPIPIGTEMFSPRQRARQAAGCAPLLWLQPGGFDHSFRNGAIAKNEIGKFFGSIRHRLEPALDQMLVSKSLGLHDGSNFFLYLSDDGGRRACRRK